LAAAQKSEPRLRNQVITPRARRIDQVRSRRKSGSGIDVLKSATRYARPVAIVAALVLLFAGYKILTNSRLFELRRVTVEGASQDLSGDIEKMVSSVVGKTLER
jgi:hypothetical protein